ncbi:MAG: hypothetical protein KJZ54_11215 [Phycisphaerales bacterium]|nr:hypothetical protein [Phycisphaerales bacterium]
MRAVQHVQLQLDRRQPVAEFRVLAGEGLLIHIVGQPQVEQPVLLGDEQRRLPRQFLPLGAGVLLRVARLRGEHQAEPVADLRVFDLHAAEEFEHLPVQFLLRHPHARMPRRGVAAAPVVDVVPLT